MSESSNISRLCERNWRLRYTNHAIEEILHDPTMRVDALPLQIRFFVSQIIEAQIGVSGDVIKLVVRTGYSHKRDLIMVLGNFGDVNNFCKVITLWTNSVGDVHSTLDESRYATK